MLIVGVLQLLG
jgi:hypothetical protein